MIITVTLNPAVDLTLTVPNLTLGAMNRVTGVLKAASGKGINVAVAVRQLGQLVHSVSVLGGSSGEFIKGTLDDLGISQSVIHVKDETRTNVKLFDAGTKETTEVNAPGPTVSVAAWDELCKELEKRTSPQDWVVLSGSLPPGIPVSAYRELVVMVQRRGGLAVVDAHGAALRQALASSPFIVKPNATEAEELLGAEVRSLDDAKRAASTIQAMGAINVLLSLGDTGAILRTPGACWYCAPPKVKVRGTIGCGDALLAAFVAGRSGGQGWSDSLRWATAFAAATAGVVGTAFPSEKAAKGLLPKVRLERFSD